MLKRLGPSGAKIVDTGELKNRRTAKVWGVGGNKAYVYVTLVGVWERDGEKSKALFLRDQVPTAFIDIVRPLDHYVLLGANRELVRLIDGRTDFLSRDRFPFMTQITGIRPLLMATRGSKLGSEWFG